METICSNCGITGNFCGYHLIGDSKKSLCLSCGEEEVEVIRITIEGSSGFFEKTMEEAMFSIENLVSEMDIDDEPYVIKKIKMKRINIESAPEFAGF